MRRPRCDGLGAQSRREILHVVGSIFIPKVHIGYRQFRSGLAGHSVRRHRCGNIATRVETEAYAAQVVKLQEELLAFRAQGAAATEDVHEDREELPMERAELSMEQAAPAKPLTPGTPAMQEGIIVAAASRVDTSDVLVQEDPPLSASTVADKSVALFRCTNAAAGILDAGFDLQGAEKVDAKVAGQVSDTAGGAALDLWCELLRPQLHTRLIARPDGGYDAAQKNPKGDLCIPFRGKLVRSTTSVFKVPFHGGFLDGTLRSREFPSAWRIQSGASEPNVDVQYVQGPMLVLKASEGDDCMYLRPFMSPAIVNTKDIEKGETLALGGKPDLTMDKFLKSAENIVASSSASSANNP